MLKQDHVSDNEHQLHDSLFSGLGLPLCRSIVPWEIIQIDRQVPRKSSIVSHRYYRQLPRVNYQIHSKQFLRSHILHSVRRETLPKSLDFPGLAIYAVKNISLINRRNIAYIEFFYLWYSSLMNNACCVKEANRKKKRINLSVKFFNILYNREKGNAFETI